MKLPVPVQGSRMFTPVVAERLAELVLQHLVDAGAHEIDDLLRRVDDAVRVGHLDRVALEEPLVDRVEEVLLLGEVRRACGRRPRWPRRSGRAT